MIKAVIFDVGGVLLRTEDQSGRWKWEKRLGLGEGELSQLVFDSELAAHCTIGKYPEEEIWKQLALRLDLEPEEIAELEKDFWSGDRLDTVLISKLKSLRPQYKTALLSNAWTGARLSFTEKYQLHEAVETMLISAEEGLAKPDPLIYHLAAQRLGIQPEEAVFVDDFPRNIAAAQQVGMHAIHFKTTRQTLDELNHLLDSPPAA